MTFAWLNEQYYKCIQNRDWPVCLLLSADAYAEYIGVLTNAWRDIPPKARYSLPMEISYSQFKGIPSLLDNQLTGRQVRFITRGGQSQTFNVPVQGEGK